VVGYTLLILFSTDIKDKGVEIFIIDVEIKAFLMLPI